jgi:hypothetical protein
MIEKLGGRKLLVGAFVMLLGVAVDSLSKNGLSANLLDLLKYVACGFFLGNGLEHAAGAYKGDTPPVAAPPSEPPASSIEVQAVAAQVSKLSDGQDSIMAALLAFLKKASG